MTERTSILLQAPDIPAGAYGADYYLDADGSPQKTFSFNEAQTLPRAQAIADAIGVPPGGNILDYGCGLGAMTAAFHRLGYNVTGVDPSAHAVENPLPEATGLVRRLGKFGLSHFPSDIFDLVLAKDVLEHIDERKLHRLGDELLRISRQVLAVIPVVDEEGKFILPLYEDDPTHITRLTRLEWCGFFPYTVVRDRHDLTPKIRRPDKVHGTLCLQFAEPNPQRRIHMRRDNPLYKPSGLSHIIKWPLRAMGWTATPRNRGS